MKLPDSMTLLRSTAFRRLFLARSVSVLGDNVSPIALAFAVLAVGGSASDLGLVLAARTVPSVLFMLAGGVWADRLPRHLLMVSADFVRFVSQGVLALLLLSSNAHVWHLVALGAVHGVASAFYRPASTGLTPQTVPRARVQEANALLFLSISFANIFGPIIGGVLVATVGTGWAIAIDSLSFGVSGLLLLGVSVQAAMRVPRPFLADLREGWDEVRSRRWLWVSIIDFALFQFVVLSAIYVLGPVVSEAELGGASAWASLASALGAGLVLGSVIGLRYRPRRPLVEAFAMVVLVTPALVLLGIAAPTALIVGAMVPAGTSLALAQTLWSTALQQNVPEHALSRVSSYDWVGSTALRPVGFAVIGPVAAALGNGTTLLGAAAVVLVLQIATLSVRELREVRTDGAEPEPDVQAASPQPVHETSPRIA
jgi:MFS family permease